MGVKAKRAAVGRGRLAETAAATMLRLKGYRILARGWRPGRGTGAGEVDIVAKTGAVVVFVEVKSRADLDTAAEAVTHRQRQRLERAAEAYLAAEPSLAGMGVRFDVVLLAPGRPPRHIKDAWRPEG